MDSKNRLKLMAATVSSMQVYKVTGDTEKIEGRGPVRLVGYYTNHVAATAAARGEGVYGNDGYIDCVTINVVRFTNDDGTQVVCEIGAEVDLTVDDPAEIRDRALAKLTPAEKKVLGLK